VTFQPTVRKRVLKGPKLHGRFVHRNSLLAPFETDYTDRTLNGIQVTESEGHPFHNKYKGKDVGGDFRTLKESALCSVQTTHWTDGEPSGNYQTFDMTITPRIDTNNTKPFILMPDSPLSFSSDIDEKGAEAVALCNPLNPVASAATFLGETLKEGLPSLPGVRQWKNRTKLLLGVADEFLNAEFGWMPMLREIGDLAKAVSTAASVMKQYQRDAGKLVRRSWYFPTERHEHSEVLFPESLPELGGTASFGQVPLYGRGVLPMGQVVRRTIVERKVCFKGAFTYTMPDQSDSWYALLQAATGSNAVQTAIGTSLTPEVLWELAPWSWALDWFSNAQEVVSNLQRFELEGLVMPYGYVMDEESTKQIYTWEPIEQGSFKQALIVSPVIRTSVSKMRKQASPFGFGLEWADLSPTQLAILAALGITLAL
jgi:hypothetical protein